MATKQSSKKPVAVQAPPEQAKLVQPGPLPPKPDCQTTAILDEMMTFFGSSKAPSVTDYEDMSRRAYRRADALLEMLDLAGYGLQETGDPLAGSVLGYAVDSIRLQVEIGRVTAEALYKHCKAFQSADSHKSQ